MGEFNHHRHRTDQWKSKHIKKKIPNPKLPQTPLLTSHQKEKVLVKMWVSSNCLRGHLFEIEPHGIIVFVHVPKDA